MDEDLGWLREKLLLAAGLVECEPKTYLLERNPTWDEGLDCDNINERARTVGIIGPDEFIIELGEDPSTDPGTPRPTRWIKFYHPVRAKPRIRIVVRESSGSRGKATNGHAQRIAAYLRAWAELCESGDRAEGSQVGMQPNHLAVSNSGCGIPSPLVSLAYHLDTLLITAGMLRVEVHYLEQDDAAGELSELVRRGKFPYKGSRVRQEESDRLQAERHRDPAIKAIRLTRDLRDAAAVVLDDLPSATGWLDDPAKAAQDRWTARVDADARELMSCPFKGQPNDVEMSDLPRPDQGIAEALGVVIERLERRRHELRSVERTRAEPIMVPTELLVGYGGELDHAEVAALLQLGRRELWGIDELPETIDADMLRCLDRHGVIDARSVHMQNRQKFPGDKTPPTPSPSEWFSPIADLSRAGGWDAIAKHSVLDERNHPWEVRVSEYGKAEAARLRRPTKGTGESEKPRRVGEGMTWRDAMNKAEYIVKRTYRGKPPLKTELKRQIGCSRNTLNKAIDRSPYLTARYAEAKTMKKEASVPLTDQHIEKASLEQNKELERLMKEQSDDEAQDRRTPRRTQRS